MNKATIFWVSTPSEPGYLWKWRVRDRQSKPSFAYYFDCVADAQQRGYEVELSRASGQAAPGGATYALERSRQRRVCT